MWQDITSLPLGAGRLQVLQYKTDQQADLKKVEKLNQLFFSLMATGKAPSGEQARGLLIGPLMAACGGRQRVLGVNYMAS